MDFPAKPKAQIIFSRANFQNGGADGWRDRMPASWRGVFLPKHRRV